MRAEALPEAPAVLVNLRCLRIPLDWRSPQPPALNAHGEKLVSNSTALAMWSPGRPPWPASMPRRPLPVNLSG